MKPSLRLSEKQTGIIAYIFFGACTTLINVLAYYMLYSVLNFANVFSTCLAWLVAVIFAYITNKLFVFKSKSLKFNVLAKEILSFFSFRIITGIIDVLIMYLAVDVLMLNSTFCKILSNIIVIILNYIAGRFIVFKKN